MPPGLPACLSPCLLRLLCWRSGLLPQLLLLQPHLCFLSSTESTSSASSLPSLSFPLPPSLRIFSIVSQHIRQFLPHRPLGRQRWTTTIVSVPWSQWTPQLQTRRPSGRLATPPPATEPPPLRMASSTACGDYTVCSLQDRMAKISLSLSLSAVPQV